MKRKPPTRVKATRKKKPAAPEPLAKRGSGSTKIDANGGYEITLGQHHNQPCVGPSVTRTDLWRFVDCPLRAWTHWTGNAKAIPDPSKEVFDFGAAAHSLVIGDGQFEKRFAVSPYDDFRKKEARQWRAAQKQTVVRAEWMGQINAMAAALSSHPFCQHAWKRGKPEVTMAWRDEITGMWLLSRPDWLPDREFDFIKDFKTVRSAKPTLFGTDCFNHGYHVQAAMMLDGAKAALDRTYQGVGLIVQEKEPPYIVEPYYFEPEQIDLGRKIYREALNGFAHCLATGQWPSYTTEPQPIRTPRWLRQESDNDNNASNNDTGDNIGTGTGPGGRYPRIQPEVIVAG